MEHPPWIRPLQPPCPSPPPLALSLPSPSPTSPSPTSTFTDTSVLQWLYDRGRHPVFVIAFFLSVFVISTALYNVVQWLWGHVSCCSGPAPAHCWCWLSCCGRPMGQSLSCCGRPIAQSQALAPSGGGSLSLGSLYAPPRYSQCGSFHNAPPPYSEVTAKPDLYPLVITCGEDSGNGKVPAPGNILMVHYFRDYFIRSPRSLSATSTAESLNSNFLCNTNIEANSAIPPSYSCATSCDAVICGRPLLRSLSSPAPAGACRELRLPLPSEPLDLGLDFELERIDLDVYCDRGCKPPVAAPGPAARGPAASPEAPPAPPAEAPAARARSAPATPAAAPALPAWIHCRRDPTRRQETSPLLSYPEYPLAPEDSDF